MITRRSFLRSSAAASAVTAALAPAASSAETTAPATTARDRFAFHLAELKKAAEELDPRIGSWNICRPEDDDLVCGLIISAHRVTGRYEGDGIYEAGGEVGTAVPGRKCRYDVKLLPDVIDGHRMFSVRSSMDRMMLAEPRFRTFIGRRVG